jgi:preprotein translocase subunit SecE
MAATKNPLQFIQEVRAEVSKVVWPTRREVMVTSTMVFVLAILTAAFFFLVDFLIRQGLQAILSLVG